MSTVLDSLTDIAVVPLGAGRFAIDDRGENQVVTISKEAWVQCDCDGYMRYGQRCSHIRATLLYVGAIHAVPDDAVIPEPPDVAQMALDDLTVYVVKLNKALNALIVHQIAALRADTAAKIAKRRAKLRRRELEKRKVERYELAPALEAEDVAETEHDETQLRLTIIKAKMDVVNTSRISAMVVMKQLRP